MAHSREDLASGYSRICRQGDSRPLQLGTLELKGRHTMNSRSQTYRRPTYRPREPALANPGTVVIPLSGPSYGAYSAVKRKWRKPLPAIIADAIANCDAVSARLNRGIYAPDYEREAHYREIYDDLCRTTRQQLEALKVFSQIDWRE